MAGELYITKMPPTYLMGYISGRLNLFACYCARPLVACYQRDARKDAKNDEGEMGYLMVSQTASPLALASMIFCLSS